MLREPFIDRFGHDIGATVKRCDAKLSGWCGMVFDLFDNSLYLPRLGQRRNTNAVFEVGVYRIDSTKFLPEIRKNLIPEFVRTIRILEDFCCRADTKSFVVFLQNLHGGG